MGMTCRLEQVTPQQLGRFLRSPSEAYDFWMEEELENPDMEPFLAMLAERVKTLPPGFRDQALRVTSQMAAKVDKRKALHLVTKEAEPKEAPPERKRFSLEKDWHVLHYVLNGTTEGGSGPLADVILGGEGIPDVEGTMSYGPLRYLIPERVAGLAKALAQVDPAGLLGKLDREDAIAKQIYLARTLAEGWEYLPELFADFRAFYEDAARGGNALIIGIE